MSGRASVDEALTAEEEKAIVAKLAVLLPALGLVACVPRLPIKRSFRDNDVYAPEHASGTSLAEHIMNELLGTINETRERQGRPLDKQLSSHTSLKRPLQALVTACGEDKPETFNRLANSLGVVVPTVRHTRRNSVLQGQENTPPSKRSKPNDPAPEFARTRTAAPSSLHRRGACSSVPRSAAAPPGHGHVRALARADRVPMRTDGRRRFSHSPSARPPRPPAPRADAPPELIGRRPLSSRLQGPLG